VSNEEAKGRALIGVAPPEVRERRDASCRTRSSFKREADLKMSLALLLAFMDDEVLNFGEVKELLLLTLLVVDASSSLFVFPDRAVLEALMAASLRFRISSSLLLAPTVTPLSSSGGNASIEDGRALVPAEEGVLRFLPASVVVVVEVPMLLLRIAPNSRFNCNSCNLVSFLLEILPEL